MVSWCVEFEANVGDAVTLVAIRRRRRYRLTNSRPAGVLVLKSD
jgi:hypothetical protein